MANLQIPNLPAAIALAGAEQLEAVQAGASVRVTTLQFAAYIQAVPLAALTFTTPLVRTADNVTLTTVPVTLGGTGATSLTDDGVIYGNGTSALGATAAGTTGQVLIGNTGAAPSWATLSGIGVTSFSGGTTGLTPSGATTGVVTLAGTLAVANGGTGVVGFGVVTSKTANYTVLAADSYKDFDNNGASGTVTFTLPAASVGLAYGFAVMEAFDLVIQAPGGVTIYAGAGSATTAGGTLTSSDIGSYISIKCRSSTEWIAQQLVPSWTPA